MDYQQREREINMKSMLFAVLYQWRKILVVAVVLAVMLGGVMGAKTWSEANDAEAVQTQENAYQEAVADYEKNLAALELEIEELQADIDTQQEYLENSVLMSMDARDFYCATASYYLSNDYQIMPGMTYQNPDNSRLIMASYLAVLTDSALMSEVAQAVRMEPRYLNELVQITGELDRILTIRVQHKSKSGAQQIMNQILQRFDDVRLQVTESIGAHTVSEVKNTIGPEMDNTLSDLQRKERDRVKTDMERFAKTQEELDSLAKPQRAVASKVDAVKSAVISAVIGAVVGAAATVVAACVWFVLTDKVQSAGELADRFGIRVLAVYSDYSGKSFLDKWFRKMECRPSGNAEAQRELLAANVAVSVREGSRVLISDQADGTFGNRVDKDLAACLPGICTVCAGSVLDDPGAVRELQNCDGVVLAVVCKDSRYSQVEKTLRRLGDAKKYVLGCVVLEK